MPHRILLILLALAATAGAQTSALSVTAGTGQIKAPIPAATFRSANGIEAQSAVLDSISATGLPIKFGNTGATSTWTADFAGQLMESADHGTFGVAAAAGTNPLTGNLSLANPIIYCNTVSLKDLSISDGTGELLLARSNSGMNVLAVRNNSGNQGDCSAIAYRASDGQERGAMGYAMRGTGTALFPFTDTVYLESSRVFGLSGPTVAPDLILEQAHLNSSNVVQFEERIRCVNGGNLTIWQPGLWPSQTAAMTFGTTVASVAPFTAPTINGNTLTAGSGTLTLGTSTLTAGASGTVAVLGSPAFTGTPTVPTAAGGTNTTQIASTAFVTSAVAAAGTTFANPTGSIGLAAVNGTAATAMRSDATPALSQAIAPTWTNAHTFAPTLAANTPGHGILLSDTTAATAGNQQYSPSIRFTGQGWKTTATAGSQAVDFAQYLLPVQGATAPSSRLVFASSVNGAAFTEQWGITSNGKLVPAGDAYSYIGFAGGTVSVVGGYGGGSTEINVSGNGFTIAQPSRPILWGGPYPGYPGLFPSGTALKIRLADNSGDAPLTTGALTINSATGTSVSRLRHGTATLTAGTVTVSDTNVSTSTRIFLTAQDNSSTGALRVSARTAGTSFTVTSNNAGDSGVVAWEEIEP